MPWDPYDVCSIAAFCQSRVGLGEKGGGVVVQLAFNPSCLRKLSSALSDLLNNHLYRLHYVYDAMMSNIQYGLSSNAS